MIRGAEGLRDRPFQVLVLVGFVVGLSSGWGSVLVGTASEIRLEYRGARNVIPATAVSGSDAAAPALVADHEKGPPEEPEHLVVRGISAPIREALSTLSRDPKPWQRIFHVSLEGTDPSLPPLMGTYSFQGKDLVFTPRFPLRPGQSYRATLDLTQAFPTDNSNPGPSDVDSQNHIQRFVFRVPASEPARDRAAVAAPRILAVFPSGSVLPENQLKFYLHFSTPMRRGEAYRHIRLWVQTTAASPRDESSREESSREDVSRLPKDLAASPDWEQIEFPFLELPEELWDPVYQRFTLFFDPGRIKRGLKPREEFGPALEEGRRYVLEVARDWRNASGDPLAETFRKSFHVIEPDDTQPEVEQWTLVPPGSADGWLRVEFDEPLDHAMLERVIHVEEGHVEEGQGARVTGEVAIDQQERRWSFRPARPWRNGSYHLVVGTHLEDRAGNSLAKPFEVDLFDEVESRVRTSHVRLPFRVGNTP